MNYGYTVLNPMTRAIVDPNSKCQGSSLHWGKIYSEVVLAPEYMCVLSARKSSVAFPFRNNESRTQRVKIIRRAS